jgi:hypothetical protein
MKKSISKIIFLVFIFIIGSLSVHAEQSIKCVYSINSSLGTKLVVTIENNAISTQLSGSGYKLMDGASKLAVINFQSNADNKWKCPSELYYKTGTTSNSDRQLKIQTIQSSNSSGFNTISLISGESSDGGALSTVGTPSESKTSCSYGSLIISFNSTTLEFNNPCKTTFVNFDQNDLTTGRCPKAVYRQSYNNICSYSLTSSNTYQTKIELNGNEPVTDADGNDTSANSNSSNATTDSTEIITSSTDCDSIFGGEFGKLLKDALSLLRFAVPILIVGLSVVDFIKATAAQDQNEIKKSLNKLVKRLIIGVLIFLLPTILDLILDLAGVEYGTCGIK